MEPTSHTVPGRRTSVKGVVRAGQRLALLASLIKAVKVMMKGAASRHLLLGSLVLGGCGTSLDTSINDPKLRVDAFITQGIEDGAYPGLQYVVVSADSVLYRSARGMADLAEQRAMEDTTLMMTYSITKTITALVTLQLIAEGAMDLDDPISRYVPYQPYGEAVTIRHLLSQTSGVPDPIPLTWAHLVRDADTYDEDSTFRSILREHDELDNVPGEDYAYSNISYWLLGAAIHNVTGTPYPEVVRKRVLQPLQLSESEATFSVRDSTRVSAGYLKEWSMLDLFKSWVMDDEYFGPYHDGWMRFNAHYLNGPSFGGLIATSDALAKILQDLLQSHSVLLDQSSQQQLFSIQHNNDGELVPMTLGWHVDLERPHVFYKEGGGGGFHGMIRVYRKHGYASVVIANATQFDAAEFLDQCDSVFVREQ